MSNFGLIRGLLSSRGRGGRSRGSESRRVGGGSANVSASFGKTLQFITEIKLGEVEKQRLAYAEHSAVLEQASALADDLPGRVELLLNAVRSWRGSGAVDYQTILAGKLDLASVDLWLLQARKDPGFSSDVVRDWADTLEAHIRHSQVRFEFAKLFGGLFNEWLASGDSVTAQDSSLDSPRASPAPTEDFVEVGRKEMYEQQDRLKSLIFQPKTIDAAALKQYLSNLFSDGPGVGILAEMRQGMEIFAEDLENRIITTDDMGWIIKSLLASDQMAESKRQTLREFSQNPTVLSEIATVMTMRLANLDAWVWPAQGAQVDMRRHLNGKYRAFTDPDVLDALFLHYIGVMWQVKFKQDGSQLFSSKAWKQEFPPFSHAQNRSRASFFAEHNHFNSVNSHRQTLRRDHFLLGQLASKADSTPVYDDDGNLDKSQVPASHIKQELLHFVATECYLNQTLHDTFTVVATDFEWFGPSLPFDTILTCLAFFGIPQKWLDFFRRFLEMPLYFKEDKPAQVRVRQCGTPISYALSAFFGEVVLFGLDYAINQRADGLFLHRIHDDVWFWHADSQKCVTAWAEIQTYVGLTGLTINQTKTGSACVGATVAPELPVGEIRWGFLKLDAEAGRFIIDQREVDRHIVELRRQLAATKSVFGWINCWNRYVAFLSRNFGARPTKSFGPAFCLGQAHLDDMIDTLARVQRELYPDGLVQHLRAVIEERFGVKDLPDGYFFFPISCGGLELRNPLIELLAVRDEFTEDPAAEFTEQMSQDHDTYLKLLEAWNAKGAARFLDVQLNFPPFEEYASYRETGLLSWLTRYQSLMKTAYPRQLNVPSALHTPRMSAMDFYDKWILALYGDQVLKKFGSLEPVDADLIPVGLVHLFSGSTAAEALLELYDPNLSVFGPAPFSTSNLDALSSDCVESLAYAASKIVLGTAPNGLSDAEGALADPASLGVSAVLLGKLDARYAAAVDDELDYILHHAPRFENGAISHRIAVAELWADFIYMVPPFLAYAGASSQDNDLLHSAYLQCALYRDVLQDPTTGLWQHIIGPENEDTGFWSTGDAWAAAGMARVLATIMRAPVLANDFYRETAIGELTHWIREILDGVQSLPLDGGLVRNYLDSTTNYSFGEVAGSALFAATAYRMLVLRPTIFGDGYLIWADSIRTTLALHITNTGAASPAVNPMNPRDPTALKSGSPEGNTFVVLMYAAWRDCIVAGVCSR
ncbi:hypothetical protein HMN09_00502800 [Mycena chlorophos]|uniref:Reverse transcriptase domain-containing protein n=1 Tax=Mycena chlorophos TaxID=658473 RepID=A0A8H6WCB4_MYCCL|nr:hypothetical protein HMN09_00502800 [Mycena chlorophos]